MIVACGVQHLVTPFQSTPYLLAGQPGLQASLAVVVLLAVWSLGAGATGVALLENVTTAKRQAQPPAKEEKSSTSIRWVVFNDVSLTCRSRMPLAATVFTALSLILVISILPHQLIGICLLPLIWRETLAMGSGVSDYLNGVS